MTKYVSPLTDEEAEILRDGQRMRVPLMMRDHAAPVSVADQQRAQQRGISLSQASYENRLSDAYKQPPPEQTQAPAAVADRAASQAAYEDRLRNAYKGATDV